MKVQYTRDERMGQNGSSLLRLLQNETIPLIDLFIREGLQNSLDATLKDSGETIVDVGAVDFEVAELAGHFDGIGETLIDRYTNKKPKAIYLSDKNTTGLTGAIRDDENEDLRDSKIYKLIYGISMNQTESGAGGSWGLGKTSFFRIGNGIVIYYTRVRKNDGTYGERLAASLIEDSEKPDALLTHNSRGIAWWGARENEDTYTETFPIDNTMEIAEILDVFGIERYTGEETGTTIIVPFVNEEKIFLHDETHDELETLNKKNKWWEESLNDRIEIAIQKWYGPRILNIDYQNKYGSYLLPYINGELLSPDKFQPFFKKIRELYICALKGSGTEQIHVKPVELERMALATHTNKIVGDFAFAKLSDSDLEMSPPDNYSHPLNYLGYRDGNDLLANNDKIIAYARKPGMIIDYDINGIWSQNVSKLENEFIIGFFVPRSEQPLHNEFQSELPILDDYLRKTENADHAAWEDVLVNDKKVTIVRRIKSKVIDILRDEFEEGIENRQTSKASALGRKLGSRLLPPTSFGKRPTPSPTIDDGGGRTKGGRNFSIDIKNVIRQSEKKLSVNMLLDIAPKISGTVSVNINMGSNHFNAQKWSVEMGEDAAYPFKITGLKILNINDEKIDVEYENLDDDRFSIILSSFNKLSSFDVLNSTELTSLKINIAMTLEINDPLIQPYIQAKEVK